MIVKIERYPNSIDKCNKELIFNVKRVETYTLEGDEFLHVEVNEKEQYTIPITHSESDEIKLAIVGAVWVMNNEGKTIERLV